MSGDPVPHLLLLVVALGLKVLGRLGETNG